MSRPIVKNIWTCDDKNAYGSIEVCRAMDSADSDWQTARRAFSAWLTADECSRIISRHRVDTELGFAGARLVGWAGVKVTDHVTSPSHVNHGVGVHGSDSRLSVGICCVQFYHHCYSQLAKWFTLPIITSFLRWSKIPRKFDVQGHPRSSKAHMMQLPISH